MGNTHEWNWLQEPEKKETEDDADFAYRDGEYDNEVDEEGN